MARSADILGVTSVQQPAIPRAEQTRAAWVIGMLLTTVLLSGLAAVLQTGGTAAASAPRLPGTSVVAAVNAAPTPVDLVFAKPAQPGRDRPAAPVPVAAPAPTPARASLSSPSPSCSGAGWEQRRGAAALASLLHPVPAGVSVSFLAGRGALKGMTYYDRHHVDVFVASCGRESDALLRHVVAHEMGHAWDSLHMTDALRARYLSARGIPAGTPWFGCNTCQDFATPAGDFAETYAQWQRGASDSRSRLAPPASAADLAALGAEFFS